MSVRKSVSPNNSDIKEENRHSILLEPADLLPSKPSIWISSTIYETILLNKGWLLKIIRFLVFYLVGIIFYSHTESNWTILDAIYFVTESITTIGYGNLHPTSVSGQIFCTWYIFCGILLIFTVVRDLTNYVFVESIKKIYDKPIIPKSKLQIAVRKGLNALKWLMILFLTLMWGTIIFSYFEGWDYQKSFYFTTITATTVGYGDIQLSHQSARIFNIFYMMISVAMTAMALDKLASLKGEIETADNLQKVHDLEMNRDLISKMNPLATDETPIMPSDYVLYMLICSGVINKRVDIVPWLQKFHSFDKKRKGYITKLDADEYNILMYRKGSGLNLHSHQINHQFTKLTSKEDGGTSSSILYRIFREFRDVMLETFKLKDPNEEMNFHMDEYINLTFNPLMNMKFSHVNGLNQQRNEDIHDHEGDVTTPLVSSSMIELT